MVCVILPYHAAMREYLPGTISAVLSQTGVEVELHLVANGSDEETESELENFLSTHSQQESVYHHVCHEIGVSHARNFALDYIQEFSPDAVAFCDADDRWHKDHLSICMNHMEVTGAKMVYSDVRCVDENGAVGKIHGIPYYVDFNRANLLKQNFIFISTVVARPDALCYRFDHELDPMSDWDYWLQVSASHRVSHSPVTSVDYMWKSSGSYYKDEDMSRASSLVKGKWRVHENNEITTEQSVPGWLTQSEGELLKRYASGGFCVEIGSYKGKSANYIAQAADKLVCIDTFACDPDGQTQGESVISDFMFNTAAHRDKIHVVISKSSDVHWTIPKNSVDLLFIDAAHDYESVRSDIKNYVKKLKHTGSIALHDYENEDYPGVKSAARELLGEPDEIVDSIAVYRSPKIKKYAGRTLLIFPSSRMTTDGKISPKDPPLIFWTELIKMLKNEGIHTFQVGAAGDPIIGADEMGFNLNRDTLTKLVSESDGFVSVDTYLQHFATRLNLRGVVIFSQSDPSIFGYDSNINILKSKKYLRNEQFQLWSQAEYLEEAFPTVTEVFPKILKLLGYP